MKKAKTMNYLGNKEVMAKNIQYYLDKIGKTRQQMADELKIPYTTVANWLQANTYPRIDKIELMADFFNVTKADLVEKRTESGNLYEKLMSLSDEKRAFVEALIDQLKS
jgi:transcriptional regulator with XRE-family HTH domain